MPTLDTPNNSFDVLLVEDNFDHAELIARNFELPGTEVRIQHLTNGQDALDYLFHRNRFEDQTEYFQPHLVLLDLRLPKIDGLEVLRQLKTDPTTRHLPVVILTTSEAQEDIFQACQNFANSYLVKNSHLKPFSEMLRQTALYWHSYNHSPSYHTDLKGAPDLFIVQEKVDHEE